MDISQVLDKIHEWANSERWRYEDRQDPDAHFNIEIHPTKTQSMNVGMGRNQDTRLTVGVNAQLTDEDRNAFPLIPEERRWRFVRDVQLFLLQIGVMYRIGPNPPIRVEYVTMMKDVYLDGITQEKFVRAVQAILGGLVGLGLYMGNLFGSPDRTRADSLTTGQDRNDRVPLISLNNIQDSTFENFQIGTMGSTQTTNYNDSQFKELERIVKEIEKVVISNPCGITPEDGRNIESETRGLGQEISGPEKDKKRILNKINSLNTRIRDYARDCTPLVTLAGQLMAVSQTIFKG